MRYKTHKSFCDDPLLCFSSQITAWTVSSIQACMSFVRESCQFCLQNTHVLPSFHSLPLTWSQSCQDCGHDLPTSFPALTPAPHRLLVLLESTSLLTTFHSSWLSQEKTKSSPQSPGSPVGLCDLSPPPASTLASLLLLEHG